LQNKTIWMLLNTRKATNPYIWTGAEDMQASKTWSIVYGESLEQKHLDAAEHQKQQIHIVHLDLR